MSLFKPFKKKIGISSPLTSKVHTFDSAQSQRHLLPWNPKRPLGFIALDFDLTITTKHTFHKADKGGLGFGSKVGENQAHIEMFDKGLVEQLLFLCRSQGVTFCICTFQTEEVVLHAFKQNGLDKLLNSVLNNYFFIFDRGVNSKIARLYNFEGSDKLLTLQHFFGKEVGGILIDDDEKDTRDHFSETNILFCKVKDTGLARSDMNNLQKNNLLRCFLNLQLWFNDLYTLDKSNTGGGKYDIKKMLATRREEYSVYANVTSIREEYSVYANVASSQPFFEFRKKQSHTLSNFQVSIITILTANN